RKAGASVVCPAEVGGTGNREPGVRGNAVPPDPVMALTGGKGRASPVPTTRMAPPPEFAPVLPPQSSQVPAFGTRVASSWAVHCRALKPAGLTGARPYDRMAATTKDQPPMRVWPGRPYPLGATWDGAGVNFALFSEHATKVELCLFDDM